MRSARLNAHICHLKAAALVGGLLGLVPNGVCPSVALAGSAPEIEKLPNVVLIAVDTLRADHLGCYGYDRPTSPHVDRLATEGVLFEACESPASWTFPAFMSVFTGLLSAAHGCFLGKETLSEAVPTLPEKFRDRGYFCAGVVSNPYLNGKFGFARGFDQYDDYSVFLQAELGLFSAGDDQDRGEVNDVVTGESVTRQALSLLDRAKKSGKPFFLFVVYFDPHDSYIPPPPYNRKYDPNYVGRMDGRVSDFLAAHPPNPRDLKHLIARYDGEIEYTDQQIGRFLTRLDQVADPAETIVILLSDHGEAFGEHGRLLHGNAPFREEVWVPLIWRWKGTLPAGRRVRTPVSTVDIAATLTRLLDFQGFELQQGASLWPAMMADPIRPPSPEQRPIFTQRARHSFRHVALTRGDLRLHLQFEGSPLSDGGKLSLFDVSTDPWETEDLVGDRKSDAREMAAMLRQTWTESRKIFEDHDQDAGTGFVELTDEEKRRLRGVGYFAGPGEGREEEVRSQK